MKYIDIYREAYSLIKQPECCLYFKGLDTRVLAWTANHEHAVFGLQDEAHPATVCVWFQFLQDGVEIYRIYKIELKDGAWEHSEVSVGRIPYVNNNPFAPRILDAVSNTTDSVFPQNQ